MYLTVKSNKLFRGLTEAEDQIPSRDDNEGVFVLEKKEP